MAMFGCGECGKKVSDKALKCVHCGVPIAESISVANKSRDDSYRRIAIYIVAGVSASIVISIIKADSTDRVVWGIFLLVFAFFSGISGLTLKRDGKLKHGLLLGLLGPIGMAIAFMMREQITNKDKYWRIGGAVILLICIAPVIMDPPTLPEQPAKRASAASSNTSHAQSRSYNGRATTTENGTACLTEQWLDDVTRFVVAGDRASFKAYIASEKCIVLKGGYRVTILESSGFAGQKVQFAYEGLKLWATAEALSQ